MASYFGEYLAGSATGDFLLSTGGMSNGGDGNDVLIGDAGSYFYAPSPGGASMATAQNIDFVGAWCLQANAMFADATVPHTSLLLSPGAGSTGLWFAVTVGAGEHITIDIDYGRGTSGHDLPHFMVLDLYDAAGNLVATNSGVAASEGGLGTVDWGDPYIARQIALGGTYYIRVRESDGAFEGDEQALLNISVSGHVYSEVGAAWETLSGGLGNDHLYGMGGDDTLYGNDGDDTIVGGAGNDLMSGDEGNDTLIGDLGHDTLYGGGGDDIIRCNSAEGSEVNAGGGSDIVVASAGLNTIDLAEGNDYMILKSSGLGNIECGLGTDTISLNFHDADRRIFMNASNWLSSLTLYIANSTATYSVTGLELIASTITLSGFGDSLNFQGLDASFFSGGPLVVFAGEGDDGITGSDGGDKLYGGAGQDHLSGGDGDDFISGDLVAGQVPGAGPANDTLLGGEGNNTIFGDQGDDYIRGESGNDTLNGGDGDDFIEAGLGTNRLDGGAGRDRVSYYSFTNVVVDLEAGYAYSLGGQNFTDTLVQIENVIGSDGAEGDLLYGNAADNGLQAYGGNDVLYGRGGNDYLEGGDGADFLSGGTGDDVLSGDVSVFSNLGFDDVFDGGEGNDTAAFDSSQAVHVSLLLQGAAQDTGDGMDTLIDIENLVGSRYNDSLTGDAQANRLEGLNGDDALFGGVGDDTLAGGRGNDRLDGGSGIDTADYRYAEAGVQIYLTRSTAQDTRGNGTDTLISIENLSGSVHADVFIGNNLANVLKGLEGNDYLRGMGGDDVLEGGAGNDTLRGETGNDIMIGGIGNDFYTIDSLGDVVVENAAEGIDTVYTAISYTLLDNFEDLRLGNGSLEGTGNAANNNIYGGSGRNALYGMAGADRIYGGGGGDWLFGGDGNDLLTGGSAGDQLTGGAGADRFIYTSLTDSANTTATYETITDFSRTDLDRIDLSALDAIAGTGTNDAFSFIGSAAFTAGTAGQVRTFASAGNTYVEMDVNGDAISDMTIRLTGLVDLTATSFVL